LFDAHPDTFGSFRVLDQLGTGQLGRVYRAQSVSNDQIVAVKVFDRQQSVEQTAALAAALRVLVDAPLDHASIARPLAADTKGDEAYLVEQFVPGDPLEEALNQDGAVLLSEVLLCITQLAGALDFAAAVGVHHGALHPREILVSSDRIAITGLGVAQALMNAGVEPPIKTSYASPQRQSGAPITRADDIYSLAAIAFEMLYGRPPSDLSGLEYFSPPAGLDGLDPVVLETVFEGSLSGDPADRPPTALELAAALQRALVDTPVAEEVESFRLELAGDVPHRETIPAQETLLPQDAGFVAPEPRAVAHDEPRAEEIRFRDHTVHRQPESLADVTGVRHDDLRSGRSEFGEDSGAGKDIATNVPVAARPPFSSILPQSPYPAQSRGSSSTIGWALLIGVLAGFAGGFFLGQRDVLRLPFLPFPHRPGSSPAADTRTTTPPPAAGQDFTDSTIPQGSQGVPRDSGSPNHRAERPDSQTNAGTPIAGREVRSTESEGGRVLVRSIPSGARVIVDGLPKGVTPLVLRGLAYGTHDVEVTYLGYETRQQRVTLSHDRPAQSVDFSLRPAAVAASVAPSTPGTLQVDSRPIGARVFLDNIPVGVTPLLLPKISAGSHAVRIEMQGYQPWLTSVSVGAGARARVAASLETLENR
jgi:serine/threonine protein kinase